MKIKKLIVVMVAACMLVMSQAAYATEVSPTAIGIGDTQATAIPISVSAAGNYYSELFLSSASDVDWYKWVNTTGKAQRILTFSGMLSGNSGEYRLGLKMEYGSNSTSLMFADDNTFQNFYVPSGATVYLRVDAVNFVSPTAFYNLNFFHFDV